MRSVRGEGVLVVSGIRHQGPDRRLDFCHAPSVQARPLEPLRRYRRVGQNLSLALQGQPHGLADSHTGRNVPWHYEGATT